MSLSTDDPLMFHFTDEPLLEEYSIAAVSHFGHFPRNHLCVDHLLNFISRCCLLLLTKDFLFRSFEVTQYLAHNIPLLHCTFSACLEAFTC